MTYKFNPLLEFGLDEVGGGAAEDKSFVGLVVQVGRDITLNALQSKKTEADISYLDANTTTSDWEIVAGLGNETTLRYIGTEPKDFIFEYQAIVRKGNISSIQIVNVSLGVDDGINPVVMHANSAFVAPVSPLSNVTTAKSTKITFTNGMTIAPYIFKGSGPTASFRYFGGNNTIVVTGEQV